MKKIIIIGAGLTGLSAAESLGKKAKVRIFEKKYSPGGLVCSVPNHGGYYLHFKNSRIKKKITGFFEKNELYEVERKAFIFIKGFFIPYPFQTHINYLPKDIKQECLLEFLNSINRNPGIKHNNFFYWMNEQYGKGIVKYFMLPYNKKMWTVHPRELTLEWMSRFVPKPTPEEIITGTVLKGQKGKGYNATFYYPKYGIRELIDKFVEKVTDIELDSSVEKINWKDKTVTVNKKKYKYSRLISTIPLKELVLDKLVHKSSKLAEHAKKLRTNAVLNINITWEGTAGKNVPKGTNWIYFPEKEYIFYRVGFLKEASPQVLTGKKVYSCYVEIAYKEEDIPDEKDHSKIEDTVIKKLENKGIIPINVKILQTPKSLIKPAYVIYDKNWNESRNFILNWLEEKDIFSGGRYGGWEYSSMDDAVEWGERLAEKCLK